MIRFLTITFFMLLSLEARENPFFPAKGEVDIPFSTNKTQKIEALKRATVTLPSTARTIESVTVKYKELDGSISSKTILLGNSIDWHLPLFVSQNIGTAYNTNFHKASYKKIAGLKFISLYESEKSLKIITKDKLIRNFLLTKPHRIVCDFKRNLNIRSYEKMIVDKKSIIKKVKFGNHKGYYRVVIELDGYYNYSTRAVKNGYLFELK